MILREILKERGITVKSLSEQLNISYKYLHNVVSGRETQTSVRNQIARFLDIDPGNIEYQPVRKNRGYEAVNIRSYKEINPDELVCLECKLSDCKEGARGCEYKKTSAIRQRSYRKHIEERQAYRREYYQEIGK